MSQLGSEGKAKNKFLAFLIAIFLGPLGFHNFYVGRWKRGFFQFGLVFLSVGAGLLITIPWAWTEALLILIGKYQLSPIVKPGVIVEQESAPTDRVIVNSKKEYIILTVLLLPILLLAIPTFGTIFLFAALFYWVGGILWNIVTKLFIRSVLRIYANIFGGGKKFLIRFSEYTLPPTSTRAERFRATRKLSLTAVFVLFFIISLIAQSNISMVTEGDIPDAVQCDDGTVAFYGEGYCDDDSLGTPCDSDCVMENSTGFERTLEAYGDQRVMLVLLFAPFITVLTAPLLVLKFSSLSIVDKKTRSMSPIGEKANDLTNIAAGFGAVVLFFQTAWKISSTAVQDGNILEGAAYVAGILLFTVLLVYAFYPLVWLPIYKFAKSFESHVYNLDNSLVDSKGIEVHQLNYANNELTITPVQQTNTMVQPSVPESDNVETIQPSVESTNPQQIDTGPSINAVSENRDQHGFEWIVHNGNNYYRQAGTNDQWVKYQN